MKISISEERCAVAEAIRHYAEESDESAYEFIHGYWPNDLADLIDPTCRMTDSEWDNGERTWGCICSACDAHIEHTYSFALDYCPHCGARVTERAMDLRQKTKL